MCFLADSVAFFKKMQSVNRYFKLFSHLPHRDLLVAVLKYSTGISDLMLHIHSRDFVSRSWMVVTTSCKRHSTQGVQDSKEITTSMQLSAQLKEIKNSNSWTRRENSQQWWSQWQMSPVQKHSFLVGDKH